jgi:hypothetical protein
MNAEVNTRCLVGLALAAALAGGCGDDGAAPEGDGGRVQEAASTPEAGDQRDARGEVEAATDAGGAAEPSLELPDERIGQAARDFCRFTFECDPKMSATSLESAEACPAIVEAFVRDGAALDGAACGLAQLDSYECYPSAGCDEQLSACMEQADLELAACPLSLGEL